MSTSRVNPAFSVKLRLLINKNINLHVAHPLRTLFLVIWPMLIFVFTQMHQLVDRVKPVEYNLQDVPSVDVFYHNTSSIFYSPRNEVINDIIKIMADVLDTPHIESYLHAADLEDALTRKDGFVGIEFEDDLISIVEMPSEMKIALRFPLHFRQNHTREKIWTDDLYSVTKPNLVADAYIYESYIEVQWALYEAILKKKGYITFPRILLKAFPEPEYFDYTYLDNLYNNFISCFSFLFLGPAIAVVRIIVTEKLKMWSVMRLMGISSQLNWLSWLIVEFILFTIPLPIIVGLMKVTICPSSDFFFLLFLFINYILAEVCFMLMIIAFSFKPLTSIILLISLNLLSGMPYVALTRNTLLESIISCLFLNSAMPYMLTEILEKEHNQVGVQWNNFYKAGNPSRKLTIGIILLKMAFVDILEILCGLYMERNTDSDKRWYYQCQRDFWCPRNRTVRGNMNELLSEQPRLPVLLEAKNLGKKYHDKDIVQDFSLKFNEGEITVFLGQNGSGKSMLLQLLAGLIPPTTGQVFVNGNDLAKTPRTAAVSFGFSYRAEAFYSGLSVFWHLVFYCRLRGLTEEQAEKEADRYLQRMNMGGIAAKRVDYLTTEMMEKLSICCALCADTKVVICDKPTALLDPLARREVFNLLRSEKAGRCILISTHFIDNSEVLSDRIVILSEGRLRSYGTAEDIINNEGPGYRIVCICLPGCDIGKVTQFLGQLIPNVVQEKVVDSEVTYRLSVDNIDKFTDVFLALESQLKKLNLDSFRVYAPTLSETFLKITGKQTPQQEDTGETVTSEWMNNFLDKQELSSWNVRKNYWYALFLKKVLYLKRHVILYCLIIVVPLFIIFYLFFGALLYEYRAPMNFDPCDLSPYPGAIAIKEQGRGRRPRLVELMNTSGDIFPMYDSEFIKQGVRVHDLVTDKRLSDYILKKINVLKEGFEETYVAAASFRYTSITVWYNRRLNHGAPLSLGMLYNSIASTSYGMNISIRNKPRPDTIIQEDYWGPQDKSQILCLLLYLGYAISPFVLLPIHENISSMRHIQSMSQVSMCSYWLSHLLFDYCVYLVIMLIGLVPFLNRPTEFIAWLMLILLCFGFSVLVITYLISLPFQNEIAGLFSVIAINWFFGLFSVIILPEEDDRLLFLHHILMFVPFYALNSVLIKLFILHKDFHLCQKVDRATYCKMYEKCCDLHMNILQKGLLYLIISGIVYLFLLILLTKLRPFAFKKRKPTCSSRSTDKMIADHREKIAKLVGDQDRLNETSLVVNQVSKMYSNCSAVNCVSLTIEPYEILGLLGLNGAGKTAIVEMILGMTTMNGGDIYVKGLSVKKKLKEYFRYIGYSPQDSTLMPFMTGRQLLRFTCLICGIRKDITPLIIGNLASIFTFSKDLDVRIHHYSQGTTRQLSIAMAVLAGTLIILDDHTAGLDINSKQSVWQILNYMRELGRSLLITSQNAQECETFCTCLAIMVNGSLRCYGTVPQLKQRYETGILIGIQLWRKEDMPTISLIENPIEGESSESSSGEASVISMPQRKTYEKSTQVSGYLRKNTFQHTSVTSANAYHNLLEGARSSIRPTSISLVRDTFREDFPDCFILDRYDDRGYVTIAIPNMEFKWSMIFSYVEKQRDFLQIKHYSISDITLEDVFLYLASGGDL